MTALAIAMAACCAMACTTLVVFLRWLSAENASRRAAKAVSEAESIRGDIQALRGELAALRSSVALRGM